MPAQKSTEKTVGKPIQPGQVLNPGGRPKIPSEVKEAFKAHTLDALAVLVEVMNDKSEKGPARVSAASCILDRAWGKPLQALELSDPDGEPLFKSIKIEIVSPNNTTPT